MFKGPLSDVSLISILMLLRENKHSGVLHVNSDVPMTMTLSSGELIDGCVLDWTGLEAVQTTPLDPNVGHFHFVKGDVEGEPLGFFDAVITEWARVCDEWEVVRPQIGSPSVVFEGSTALLGGEALSVREIALRTGRPLLDVASDMAVAVQAGQARPLERRSWLSYRLPHDGELHDDMTRHLDGTVSFGDLLKLGFHPARVREYVVGQINSGWRFPGCGWVIRDLTWEADVATRSGGVLAGHA
ncbi:DUF4388 domain-containing protein [Deinococcus ficus]|uniref:PatA-like N-terminal domain-containing protein n=1 Tax=Deinococcus ficus TaxID=317577 RepID=A0A221T3I9_9DEIO|nr:DUF4388 domain-containing protein [Deinococcus ficus]ASN83448.1 hypothetical protein DFI_19820 [Deinococcus ficus]